MKKVLLLPMVAIALLVASPSAAQAPGPDWTRINPKLLSPVEIEKTPNPPIIVDTQPVESVEKRPVIKIGQSPIRVTVKPSVRPPEPRSAPKLSIAEGRALAKNYAAGRLSEAQFSCLNNLWNKESGWNYKAYNRYSGAYGIPQALPGSKMATAGADWKTNPITQVKWGIRYVNGRYGSACGAWRFWQSHHWY